MMTTLMNHHIFLYEIKAGITFTMQIINKFTVSNGVILLSQIFNDSGQFIPAVVLELLS